MWLCWCVISLCVLFWWFAASTELQCSSLRSTDFKFSISSQRNKTGHWNAQVQLEHGASNKDAGPWDLKVDHSTTKCENVESVLIIANITGSPQKVITSLPPGYELITGLGKYKFHTEAKKWQEARKICTLEDAHLVIINSQREADALLHFWVPHPKIFDDWRNDWAHIGFHDKYTEGEFVTIFDEPLNSTGYTKWSKGEPNGITSQDCEVVRRESSALGDVGCGVQLSFFCEQEL